MGPQIIELTEAEQTACRKGLLLHRKDVKKILGQLENSGLDPSVAEAELRLLEGHGNEAGLLARMGYTGEDEKPKKKPAQSDPQQTSIDDQVSRSAGDDDNDELDVDRRTWDRTKAQVEELVTGIVNGEQPAAAIAILNALESGEKQRDPRPRENVLGVIRSARSSLTDKVRSLKVN